MQKHRLLVAMIILISTPQELGLLLRATRKWQKLRIDDVAGSAGVGPVFVREVERGKPTVQLGKVMQLLAELGVALHVDVPADVSPVPILTAGANQAISVTDNSMEAYPTSPTNTAVRNDRFLWASQTSFSKP
jgi:hypothetical protein